MNKFNKRLIDALIIGGLFASVLALDSCVPSSDTERQELRKRYTETNVSEIVLSDGTPCAVYRGYNITCGWGYTHGTP